MTTFHPDGDLTFQLAQLLNEGLELGDNFRGATLEVDLAVGDNEILHGLGFVPTGYIVLFPGTTVSAGGAAIGAIDVVKRTSDDFLLFLAGSFGVQAFTGTRLDEWTTEILFLNASVVSLKVRLFVL